jgi:imidazole glycerol-phosphate synthase subunit HisF
VLRPRIIPFLLVHEGGLVKTIGFKDPKYVGDPINALKIFNEKEADELCVVDMDASVNGVEPDYKAIEHMALECRMPLCYGGGVRTAEQAKRIIGLGVEKVSLSAAAVERPELVAEIAEEVGRQSVVVVIDAKRKMLGRGWDVVTHNARRPAKLDALDFAARVADLGAGEIVMNSVDLDGKMTGYDLELARRLRERVKIPMTMLGGAGKLEHLSDLFAACGVVGAAAGSLFVFKGQYKAVLINYPKPAEKEPLFAAARRA